MSPVRPTRTKVSRRGFLGAAVALQALLESPSSGAPPAFSPDYGAPQPIADGTTGELLLKLPSGFSYFSYSWTGDVLAGLTSRRTPGGHDGMGVVHTSKHNVVLVRNHEISTIGLAFGGRKITYDPLAAGGTTNLLFDQKSATWNKSWASLAGTSTNCAGGPTPWGSWLTCEETVAGTELGFAATHGWIFEVPGWGRANAKPLRAMGRFVHEAVAVDPVTGWAYETEDRNPCGFYRFVANVWGALEQGGQLQMLEVDGRVNEDLRGGVPIGSEFPVGWVDIDDPTRAHSPGTADTLGVFSQGFDRGGAVFTRGEGCWYDGGRIHFVCTNGGSAGKGQVWEYDPRRERLTLLFESPGGATLNNPDNLAVSPRGGLILCEDGGGTGSGGNRLLGLTREGELFVFAENAIPGNESSEWAGATFSPSGPWLFVNIQTPGVTFAITGPWNSGAL